MPTSIKELRELHRKLGGLLDDNEQGCTTWKFALSETLLEMADYAGHGRISKAVKDHAWKELMDRLEEVGMPAVEKLRKVQQKVSVLLDNNEPETPAWNEELLEVLIYMDRFSEDELELRLRYL